MSLTRRSLLRWGALAPLAAPLAAASAKLGAVGATVQKVTASSAVRALGDAFARGNARPDTTQQVSIARVEYVGEHLADVRYVTRYEAVGPSSVDKAGNYVHGAVSYGSFVSRQVFNAGSEALHYAGRIMPPGVWTYIDG